jgi:uncharacterized membrane protein YgcG
VHRHPPRRALRAGATALAAGLLALGAPASGQAVAADASLEFTSDQSGDPVTVEPYENPTAYAYLNARYTGSSELTDFTVTIDATALKDQMSLSVTQSCAEKQKLLLVCDGKTLNRGKPLKPGDILRAPFLHFKTLATARPGFTGAVRVFGQAGDTALGEITIKTAVAEVGPIIDRGRDSTVKSTPGATLRPEVGFTHYSSRPLQGVYVTTWFSQGLSLTDVPSNCEVGREGGRCHIEAPVEPGGSYDLDGFALKVGGTALSESWNLSVSATTKGYESMHLTDAHRGTGRAMRLVPRAGGAGKFEYGSASGGVYVANDYDLEAVGATLDGKAGQVVKAELGVRNNGPATIRQWWGEGPGDDPAVVTKVTVPPGTTAVKVPKGCYTFEDHKSDTPGAKSYSCFQDHDDYYFDAKQFTPFDFELRIDDPKKLAPGSVKVDGPDSNNKNNTAAITVTVDGKPAGGSGGSGSTGGSGSSTGGSGSTGGTGSSTGGSGSTASGGTAQGSMADTGAGALPWYATAAGGALALGAALSVLVRRRVR